MVTEKSYNTWRLNNMLLKKKDWLKRNLKRKGGRERGDRERKGKEKRYTE
jgi:hypothetical protein